MNRREWPFLMLGQAASAILIANRWCECGNACDVSRVNCPGPRGSKRGGAATDLGRRYGTTTMLNKTWLSGALGLWLQPRSYSIFL